MTIENMTEKRIKRRIWQTQKAEYRAKLKTLKEDTPPPSLDSSLVSFQQRKKQERARVAYRQTIKAYRKIAQLKSTVDALKTSKARYKIRWMHLKSFAADSQSQRSSTLPSYSSTDIDSSIVTTAISLCSTKTESSHGNGLDEETIGMIKAFFTRDDNSRINTGKKTSSY